MATGPETVVKVVEEDLTEGQPEVHVSNVEGMDILLVTAEVALLEGAVMEGEGGAGVCPLHHIAGVAEVAVGVEVEAEEAEVEVEAGVDHGHHQDHCRDQDHGHHLYLIHAPEASHQTKPKDLQPMINQKS